MKKFWIATDVEEDGKYYAFSFFVSENANLVSELAGIRGICFASIQPSKEAAHGVVAAWNDAHKANGNYMFDD